jgi:soluble cytochrome b562
MATNPKIGDVSDVIDALQSIENENDRWHLAELLKVKVPNGDDGFDEIIAEAEAAGITKSLSVTTLRLYRDTAKRWPADKRIPGLNFSVHREVLPLIAADGNTNVATRVLRDVERTAKKEHEKVTVARVRAAVRIERKMPPPKTTDAAAKAAFDALHDLQHGAPKLIAAIGSGTDADALSKLHDGLTKTLGHVDKLRARRAQKAAAKKTAAAPKPAAPKAAAPTAKKAPAKKRGNLRGL